MLENSLRARAKYMLGVITARVAKRTAEGAVPSMTPDEARAGNFFLRVYEATIDEYKAQNPAAPKVLQFGDITPEACDEFFANSTRPGLQ